MDPVEKKPLFHFRPGTMTFSIASAGCNLTCPFCQNHSLSQALHHTDPLRGTGENWSPQEVVDAAERKGSKSISFTYSEPILSFEFARDVADLALPRGIELIFVTNGQINEKPAKEIAGFIAGANVDLKTSVAGKYKDALGGSLKATTRTIELLFQAGVWVEVTTLVIPDFNDSDKELSEIAKFIKGIDKKIPWHVSRFHPDYLWTDRSYTPESSLRRARDIGLAEGLNYVYVGNLAGNDGEKTFCPGCGKAVIDRRGYRILHCDTQGGKCKVCGEHIPGVGIP
jgi:pyruvate formate lyase activating enzyme